MMDNVKVLLEYRTSYDKVYGAEKERIGQTQRIELADGNASILFGRVFFPFFQTLVSPHFWKRLFVKTS